MARFLFYFVGRKFSEFREMARFLKIWNLITSKSKQTSFNLFSNGLKKVHKIRHLRQIFIWGTFSVIGPKILSKVRARIIEVLEMLVSSTHGSMFMIYFFVFLRFEGYNFSYLDRKSSSRGLWRCYSRTFQGCWYSNWCLYNWQRRKPTKVSDCKDF